MGTQVDHLSHLAQESARFAEAIRQAPPQAPVPTCPGWNADDLLWHLAKVQYFWGTVVREGLADGKADIQAAMADPGQSAGAQVGGAAADLDCWLWHRPSLGHLHRSGDLGILAGFEATIGPGIN